VVCPPSISLELLGNFPVPETWKLHTDGSNTKKKFCLHLPPQRALGPGFVVEAVPRDIHDPAYSLDAACELFPPGKGFPLVFAQARLFSNRFLKNSFSEISLPTSYSSFSILSFRAASRVSSFWNLLRLYFPFQ